ncbi:hypothetical protein J6590_019011 [Homalodisca vitripennis]|nr:hypothetical protein J6590_019011 [Homalodisca vitripennis]
MNDEMQLRGRVSTSATEWWHSCRANLFAIDRPFDTTLARLDSPLNPSLVRTCMTLRSCDNFPSPDLHLLIGNSGTTVFVTGGQVQPFLGKHAIIDRAEYGSITHGRHGLGAASSGGLRGLGDSKRGTDRVTGTGRSPRSGSHYTLPGVRVVQGA